MTCPIRTGCDDPDDSLSRSHPYGTPPRLSENTPRPENIDHDNERQEQGEGQGRRKSHPGQHSRPSRILFASCNNQNLTSPLWDIMSSREAAAFVWGGDAIYAGKLRCVDIISPPHSSPKPAPPAVLYGAFGGRWWDAG